MYNYILVDVFNQYYRFNKDVKKMVNFIEGLINKLEFNGKVYLLFDPIPDNEITVQETYVAVNERKNINKDYKSNRAKNVCDINTLHYIYEYFFYKNDDNFVLVKNNSNEADDFVKPLIKLLGTNKKYALLSTDYDWARYISNNIEMINHSFEQPFTTSDFVKKFNHEPSELFVVLYKAIYGDDSDNIKSLTSQFKIKFYKRFQDVVYNFLENINNNESPNEFINRLERDRDTSIYKDNSAENEFITMLKINDYKTYDVKPYDYFINNIRLIECRCTDDALKNSIIKTKLNKNYFSYAKKKLGLDFERKVVLGGLKI